MKYLLWIFFLFKLAIWAWALDKGIELCDEGIFLMSMSDPEEYKPFFLFYNIGRFYRFLGLDSLYDLRLIRIIVEPITILIFALAAGKLITAITGAKRFFHLSILVGFSGAFLEPFMRALGYNEISNSLSLICGAFLLFLVYHHFYSRQKSWLLHSGAIVYGASCGYLAFIKPTVPISLFLLFVFILLQLDRKLLMKLGSIMVLSCTAIIAIYILQYGGFQSWYADFQESLVVTRLVGYRFGILLMVYWFLDVVPSLVIATPLLVVGVFRSLRKFRAHVFILTYVGVLIYGIFYTEQYMEKGDLLYFQSIPIFMVFAFRKNLWSHLKNLVTLKAKPGQLLLIIAFFIPVAVLFGSSGSFLNCLPGYYAPFFLGLLYLSQKEDSLIYSFGAQGTMAFVFIIATSLFLKNHVFSPFGLNGNIFEHNKKVDFLEEDIYVTEEDFRFWRKLKAAVEKAGFEKGDAIIPFRQNTAMAYMLGGRMPFSTSYYYDIINKEVVKYFLTKVYEQEEEMPYLIVPNCRDPYQLEAFMEVEAMDFEHYEKVETIATPFQNFDDFYINYDSLTVYRHPSRKREPAP